MMLVKVSLQQFFSLRLKEVSIGELIQIYLGREKVAFKKVKVTPLSSDLIKIRFKYLDLVPEKLKFVTLRLKYSQWVILP